MSQKCKKYQICCHQTCTFKLKMHQNRYRSGLYLRPPWESLRRSSRPVIGCSYLCRSRFTIQVCSTFVSRGKKKTNLLPQNLFFQAENAPKSVLLGAVPRTPLGKLTTLPRLPGRLGERDPSPFPPDLGAPLVAPLQIPGYAPD